MGDNPPIDSSRRRFLANISGGSAIGVGAALAEPGSATVGSGSIWERPPDQRAKGNRRNLIFLHTDTFRADNLRAYGGNGLVNCPNLDRFAEDCVIFEDCFAEGMPTIPIRRVLLTGRRIIPCGVFHQPGSYPLPGWHRLFYEDQTIAESLREAGYRTALIADNPALQKPGMDFHRGYRYVEWLRRSWLWIAERSGPPVEPEVARQLYPQEFWDTWDQLDPVHADWARRDLATFDRLAGNNESIIELSAKKIIRWLHEHCKDTPFFLHLEAFDPHEPWTPSQRFLDEYLPDSTGPKWCKPPQNIDIEIPQNGIERLRSNYASAALEVDYWIGEILAAIEELKLFESSVVVFFSDHGTMLGEQGHWSKGSKLLRRQVIHTPFLVRLPGKEKAGTRAAGLIHHPDVLPTLFHLLELDPPPRVTGENLWSLTRGDASPHEGLVQSYGRTVSIRTNDWQFSRPIDQADSDSANLETLGYVTTRAKQGESSSLQLYNRASDPDELANVASQHPTVIAKLSGMIDRYLESGKEITSGHFHAREDLAPPENA